MAKDDFDVDGLAAYLHMMPGQIARLAERDKLPGRRVGGEWRFSQSEIHHWLEKRIGLSDQGELVEMESVLLRSAPPGQDEAIELAQLLPPEAITVSLPAKTRASVITAMTNLAAETGLLWDAEKMAEAVRAREDMQTTAMEGGVALLHPRRPMSGILGQALIALGITPTGIPFGGRSLTDVFFLICSVDDRGHLRTLARLSRLLADASHMAELRQAPDAVAIRELIAEWDSQRSAEEE